MKTMGKKAEGLSISVVVIAALAIIVLVVLVIIFSGRLSLFNKALDSCPPEASNMVAPEGLSSTDGKCPGSDDLPRKVINKGGVMTYCCP